MKKNLTKIKNELYYYDEKGEKVIGVHKNIRGDVSGIRGNVSGLNGSVMGLRGDVTGLIGDVTGLSGVVTDLSGNIDDCEITEEERAVGIDISELINKKDGK